MRLPVRLPALAVACLLVAFEWAGATASASSGEIVSKRFGRAMVRADLALARPGGVVVVSVSGLRPGAASAILDGRRSPFFGNRALVPVPADGEPGPHTLGVEVRNSRGRLRLALPIALSAAPATGAARLLPPEIVSRLSSPQAILDGRLLLSALRSSGPQAWQAPPLSTPAPGVSASLGFGAALRYVDAPPVGPRFDGLYGEVHRGLDYDVPSGTPVLAPGAGVLSLAESLSLSGNTLVIDHGQGLVSMLCHLSRLDVHAGEAVTAGMRLGLSGETGIAAATPHLHWAVYLHGIAIDPVVALQAIQ